MFAHGGISGWRIDIHRRVFEERASRASYAKTNLLFLFSDV